MIVGPLAVRVHTWTLKAHPNTLDLYLLSFDSSLRVQLAFIAGNIMPASLGFTIVPCSPMHLVTVPMALVYTGRLVRFRERAFPCMLAFLLVGPMAFLFYNLFPACGPLYVFGQAFPFHPLPFAICPGLPGARRIFRIAKCRAVGSFCLRFAGVVVFQGAILDRAGRRICLPRLDCCGDLGLRGALVCRPPCGVSLCADDSSPSALTTYLGRTATEEQHFFLG